MNAVFVILLLHLAYCTCYVGYEMFQGFDITPSTKHARVTLTPPITSTDAITTSNKPALRTIKKSTSSKKHLPTSTIEPTTAFEPVTAPKFACPEHEQPSNIGSYEVPTHRDIMLLVRKTLISLFNRYHERAMTFLRDIKEVTRATSAIERKCTGYGADSASYRKCVRQISNRCELITKELVKGLEAQRMDVAAFTNGTICSVKELKADPVDLIKSLAKEDASLDFALPGFLRLLNVCSSYCDRIEPTEIPRKPLRHMTDHDLVIKHFLTKKNYIQLLKGLK